MAENTVAMEEIKLRKGVEGWVDGVKQKGTRVESNTPSPNPHLETERINEARFLDCSVSLRP